VLDLGCGMGKFAALVARERGALIDAVDSSPTQHERAVTRYGDQRGVRFMLADAVTHLRRAEPYDPVCSVHGLGDIDPDRLLPALTQALKPGGRLLFSVLHTNSAGTPPSSTITPRPEILPPADGGRLTVHKRVLTPGLWESLLTRHGLVIERIDVLDAPEPAHPVSCRLIHARRPESLGSCSRDG
jgi:SAM-dependent methyltransferase